jgi:SecD/SecF fusion protein
LGYSLYDTIIVFDRIRENVPRMPRAAFSQIVNRSMSEVLTRSIATTSCTLLPIIALLLFGGSTLQDFAFALLIGVTSGAYSSIFIAAPLLNLWKEHRDPEYARRKGQDMPEGVRADRFLAQAERAAAAEPVPPTPLDVVEDGVAALTDGQDGTDTADAKLERRRQRRKSRPHGRAR